MQQVREITDAEIIKIYKEENGNKKRIVQRLNKVMSKSNAYRRINLIEEELNLYDNEYTHSLNIDQYIPSLEEYTGFMERVWFEQLFAAYLSGKPCLLIGETGCGKTEAIRYLAAKENLPFLRISLDASSNVQDFLGQLNLTNGNTRYTPSNLLILIQHPSIILFDEVNAANAGKLIKLHEFLDSRTIYVPQMNKGRGQVVKAHQDCRIFLSANPPSAKYAGTQRFNIALLNRDLIIKVPSFTTDEIKTILPINGDIQEPLLRLYHELRKMATEQNLRYEISLRNLKHFCELYSLGSCLRNCLEMSILNHISLSSGIAEQEAAMTVAKSIFGRRLESD